MKKFLLSFLVIFAFAAYAIHLKTGGGDEGVVLPPTSLSSPAITTDTKNSAASGNSVSPKNSALQPKGQYKDGEYVGDVTDAYYGNVQVKAVISGGRIVDVVFLEYPNDRGTSIRINRQAMPYLTQEAIQAQSTKVDGVSGATQTSGAFVRSLASALSQAK